MPNAIKGGYGQHKPGPVTHEERIEWAQLRVVEAARNVSAWPDQPAFRSALKARLRELDTMMLGAAESREQAAKIERRASPTMGLTNFYGRSGGRRKS